MKVIKGDLSTIKTSAEKVFEAEVTDAESAIKALDSFIGAIGPGTKLTGDAYNAIKTQLSSYKSLMVTRKALANSMKSAVASAVSSMSGYMDGYSELDTADLDDINSKITSAQSSINSLRNQLDGSTLSNSDKLRINSLIGSYESTLTELNKKKEKLDGLSAADSSAYASLSGAIADLSAYSSGTGSTSV